MAAAFMALRRKRRMLRARMLGLELQNGEVARAQAPKNTPSISDATLGFRHSSTAIHKDVLPHQTAVRNFYNHRSVTLLVAVLIILNFFINIAEKEIDPSSMFGAHNGMPDGPTRFPAVWQGLEDTFNSLFLLELIINW
jgi:hypothetical protein